MTQSPVLPALFAAVEYERKYCNNTDVTHRPYEGIQSVPSELRVGIINMD
jgi:hypothetical protein